MRKNTYFITLIVGMLALGGCKDFLNQSPQDFASNDKFFKTEGQIKEGLNGAYNYLQTIYDVDYNDDGSSFWAMTEMRSDNSTFTYRVSNRGALQREQIDHFEVTPDNNYTRDVWSAIYTGIQQCNTTIVKANDVESDSSGSKNKIIGQAKFIRALFYFHIVRLWGNVPLVLEAITSPDQTSDIKQVSSSEIYDQIIKDAKDAVSKLPVSWPQDQVGRVTKGAANTLLGEVYLTQKKYQDAISSFQKVIESGTYSLVPDYADLYDPANKNNSESVFEIQFDASVEGEASSYIYTWAPVQSGATTIGSFSPSGGDGRNVPTRNMISAYNKGDKRKDASIAWYVDPQNEKFVEAQHDSIPWAKKYAAKPAEPDKQNVDFYVYRYAQILLWNAEALNEVGKTGQAYTYINKVRERAGLSALSGMSQSQFRKAVYHEERVENAFEDHRWFQLLRTGRALSVMTENGKEQKEYQTWLASTAYNIQEFKLLFPIPIHNVELTDNLKQNTGW